MLEQTIHPPAVLQLMQINNYFVTYCLWGDCIKPQ
jgi:hypothetical protein